MTDSAVEREKKIGQAFGTLQRGDVSQARGLFEEIVRTPDAGVPAGWVSHLHAHDSGTTTRRWRRSTILSVSGYRQLDSGQLAGSDMEGALALLYFIFENCFVGQRVSDSRLEHLSGIFHRQRPLL